MSIDRLLQNLRVLLRANGITNEIRIRHVLARTSLHILAGLAGCFGLLMLDVAAFFALAGQYGQVQAALIIGVANLVVAGVIFFVSTRINPGRELALAKEIQDMALAVVMQDAKDVQSTLSAVVHHPLDAALTATLGHLTTILVKQLRPHEKHTGS